MKTAADHWSVLTLKGDQQSVEIISAVLSENSLGNIDKDDSIQLFFDPHYKDRLDVQLNELSEKYIVNFSWSEQPIENWHLSWQDNFTPINVEDKILIIPDWDEEYSHTEHIIRIKPAMAFGTGHHETTWLMLQALVHTNIEGCSILDLGTGSGILAIAASKLGAGRITAVEYDSVCEENFNENRDLNGIPLENITYHMADATVWEDMDHDIILANINRSILLKILPNLALSTAKIFLSGILDTDEELMRKSCNSCGFDIINTHHKGEWILMELNNAN
jgi:ribosomal protein L11 methyltransferase